MMLLLCLCFSGTNETSSNTAGPLVRFLTISSHMPVLCDIPEFLLFLSYHSISVLMTVSAVFFSILTGVYWDQRFIWQWRECAGLLWYTQRQWYWNSLVYKLTGKWYGPEVIACRNEAWKNQNCVMQFLIFTMKNTSVPFVWNRNAVCVNDWQMNSARRASGRLVPYDRVNRMRHLRRMRIAFRQAAPPPNQRQSIREYVPVSQLLFDVAFAASRNVTV